MSDRPLPPALADLAARGLVSSGTTDPPTRAGGSDDRPEPPDGAAPPADKAVTKALGSILRRTAQRPITEAEAVEGLERRELPPEVIDAAIAEARRQRAIDDVAFCRMWVEDRGLRRGFGAARLRTELRRRKADPAAVDAALAALEERDDEAAAEELARARLRALPARLEPDAVARRLVAYLVRRGHHPGLAQRVAIRVSGLDRTWD